MNEIELNPCPFCGSEDVTCDRLEDVYYVECWDCGAKIESYNGMEDAVAGWNARAIDRDALLKVADGTAITAATRSTPRSGRIARSAGQRGSSDEEG